MADEARLSQVVNQIYIPKMKAKFHAPYFYNGEELRFLNQFIDKKFDPKRDPDQVVLGIESSFDESAACLMDSFGQVRGKDVRYTQPDVSEEFNGGVDPKKAEKHHQEYLPRAVEEAMEGQDASKLRAIAVTQGPGQI